MQAPKASTRSGHHARTFGIGCGWHKRRLVSCGSSVERERLAKVDAEAKALQAERERDLADLARNDAIESAALRRGGNTARNGSSTCRVPLMLREYCAAYAAIRDGDWARAQARLNACVPTLRRWEWRYLSAEADNSIENIKEDYSQIKAVSQDGRKTARATRRVSRHHEP